MPEPLQVRLHTAIILRNLIREAQEDCLPLLELQHHSMRRRVNLDHQIQGNVNPTYRLEVILNRGELVSMATRMGSFLDDAGETALEAEEMLEVRRDKIDGIINGHDDSFVPTAALNVLMHDPHRPQSRPRRRGCPPNKGTQRQHYDSKVEGGLDRH